MLIPSSRSIVVSPVPLGDRARAMARLSSGAQCPGEQVARGTGIDCLDHPRLNRSIRTRALCVAGAVLLIALGGQKAIVSAAESSDRPWNAPPGVDYSAGGSSFAPQQSARRPADAGNAPSAAWRTAQVQPVPAYGAPSSAPVVSGPYSVVDAPVLRAPCFPVPNAQSAEVLVDPPVAIPVTQSPPPQGMLINGDPNTWWEIHGAVRGSYLNDQRIEWSGVEATFGAEAVVSPVIRHRYNGWEFSAEGEFYLNQPFDRNILVNTNERISYANNFRVDPFEISQLLVRGRYGDLMFAAGKMETPFGRTYFPIYTNSRIDAPFIRTEAILWRETGGLVHYKSGLFVIDAAVANGGPDRDANSSKALIARAGLEDQNWAVGCSVKHQDGIGSEEQKEYKSHVGVDAMYRFGPFTLSAEAIYDQYGFVRPGYNPDAITWGRSIYYRYDNYRDHVPICGIGYYVNLTYQSERWTGVLNYGEYYPGDASSYWQQKIINRRGIAKLAYAFSPHLNWYNVVMLETDGYVAQDDRKRKGAVVLTGIEYGF